jgi:DNA-binding SARP family transcriptional activator
LEFGILGPLELRTAAGAIGIEARKRRELLAILLLHPNELLSAGRLQHELWGEAAPQTAANTLQVHVSRLRKLLVDADADVTLASEAGGYVLRTDPQRIDAERFGRLVEGAAAERDAATRAATLREALDLWRGPALADVLLEGPSALAIDRLDHARVVAIEEWIDAELECGRHASLVAELESLVGEHPFRERLRAQLMLALYRAGRQVDALEAYRAARITLADDLGIEPGPDLRRLETAILQHDPSLDRPLSRPDASDQPHPEVRKTVTALAARLTPGPNTDPEVAATPLEQAAADVAGALTRAGASIERQTGDEVVAIFGVPVVHEDDPLRAARAALALVAAEAGAAAGQEISIRVGVATGDVLASGTRVRGGLPVAEAVRLREAAAPGDAWLAETTHARVADVARAEHSAPQRGWVLHGLVERRDGPSELRGPLVGRAPELEELKLVVDNAAETPAPTLFSVVGPAGIGKSRLVAELAAALGGDARVLTGRCLPYGEGITFWPLLEIVRSIVGDDLDALERAYGDDPDAGAFAAAVAGAAGLGAATSAGATDVPVAVRKLFERLARERPLLVVVDDAHWAEPTFLELLEHVVLESAGVPLVVVAVARDEPGIRWPDGVEPTELELAPLLPEDAQELVALRAHGLTLDVETARTIAENAAGNPLFIEQLVAVVRDGGDPSTIPESLRGLLAARLDLLDPPELIALQTAAVVGQEVWTRALVELTRDRVADIEGTVARLVAKELLHPARSTLADEEAFRFRHLLVHDAAYESLPKAMRGPLHEQLAGWIEATSSGSTLDEFVGYHFEQAAVYRRELGDSDAAREPAARASERLLRAGHRAAARSDVPAALNLLGRGIGLLEPGDARRAELLTDLADLYRERGEFADAGRRSSWPRERTSSACARRPRPTPPRCSRGRDWSTTRSPPDALLSRGSRRSATSCRRRRRGASSRGSNRRKEARNRRSAIVQARLVPSPSDRDERREGRP